MIKKKTELRRKYRAKNHKARRAADKRNYKRTAHNNLNRGKRWLKSEEKLTLISQLTDREKSEILHRTVLAIRTKRRGIRKEGLNITDYPRRSA